MVLALFNAAGTIALAPRFNGKWTHVIFLFTTIVHNEHELTSEGRLFYERVYSTELSHVIAHSVFQTAENV